MHKGGCDEVLRKMLWEVRGRDLLQFIIVFVFLGKQKLENQSKPKKINGFQRKRERVGAQGASGGPPVIGARS